MKLPHAFFIVLREQDAFEPFLFMSGHLRHEVVTVNEQSNISFPLHQQCRVAEAFRICAKCACQRPLASTVPYMHFLSKRASLSPYTSIPRKCELLMSYIARVRLPFSLFLVVGDEQREREECFHTFQRWHPAEEFRCRGNIGFLHGLLDLSLDQPRRVVGSIRVALVSVNPT